MRAMRQYLTTVLVVWTAACIAAYFYSKQQNIPASIAYAVVPAFLAELAFYLVPGFEGARKRFGQIGSKAMRSAMLMASALIPYLMVSSQTHTFSLRSFGALLVAAAVASFWYARNQRGAVSDVLFMVVMALVYLSKLFPQVYVRPAPHVAIDILGKLMWIRVGLMAVLSIRGMKDVQFGFLPSASEWRIGVAHYLYFLPVGGLAAYLLRAVQFRPMPVVWWKFPFIAVGAFVAILWVVALAEEFFFRGFLQQLITRGLHNEALGVLAASMTFGLVHLPFRGFPNWKWVMITFVLGIFCGLAFAKANSVRASMVTHALVVTTWRMLFTG
jgi:membrane protease YdiL (CAAX protease family)